MTENEILKLVRKRGINVVKISEEDFEDLKNDIYDAGMDRSNIQESVAMLLIIEGVYSIVINNDCYKEQPEDIKVILLAHELSHSEGYIDEEKADFNSLKFLNRKQKKVVIKNWVNDHKRKFLEFFNIVKECGYEKDFNCC